VDYSYTDGTGNFRFLIDKQYDNKNLILQLRKQDNTNQRLFWKLDNKYNNVFPVGHFQIDLTNEDKECLDLNRKIFLVGKIYHQMQGTDRIPVPERRFNFYSGTNNYTTYPADYVALNDFVDISQNILPGVKFRSKKDSLYLNVVDVERNEFFTNGATVLLNGVPLNDLSYLSPLGSKEIKKIDVVESDVIYGDLSFYGIVSIQTNDGIVPLSYLEKNACLYKNAIYENYSNQNGLPAGKTTIESNIPDIKQTLYWNPDMTVCGNNKVILEFSASGLQSEYEINIQGITNGGIPISSSTHFTVK
jgi:hypothetical protein